MASYAAVLSVFHTLNHINIHPRPPIFLDQSQVKSLTQNLTFLQEFLERRSSEDDDELESRITAAAYAAEDVIESHIVDRIHARTNISTLDSLSQGLERVIQDMGLIKKELMIKEKTKGAQHHHHLHTSSSASVGAASPGQNTAIVDFDDFLINQVLDKLTGQQRNLQIVPIVGMGGIGKTTLARNIYANPLIVQRFDILAWVTVSQEYSRGNILQLLCQEIKGSINGMSEMSKDEIGLILYQHLCGRRYLIVMDDIWSVEAWYEVKSFFPDNDNGSRIMITTRLSNMAFELCGCHGFQVQFLDEDRSWDLLCRTVFGERDCPIELESIGKKIATKCRGLPLSIAVIGGLLKSSNMTPAYWIYTLDNLNLLINLEDDEYTLRVLRTSYKELPMHLKPCFLYMGIFPEDDKIKVSMLIKLWVAEGILKHVVGKSLEEVAKEYLKELIDRNLILIPELHQEGDVRFCKIHDLLRDLCLREAKKQKFFRAPDMESESMFRSLLYTTRYKQDLPSLCYRLLRVYSSAYGYDRFSTQLDDDILELANLRYLSLKLELGAESRLLSSCSLFWNLQTLKVGCLCSSNPVIASAIWEMPLLRHVKFSEIALSDPPDGEHKFVLENLQTLSRVRNFNFSEEAVKRIPNVKKLKVKYQTTGVEVEDYCINNLGGLRKLESFNLDAADLHDSYKIDIRRNLVSFPHSLKKLILRGTKLSWEDLTIKIGSLPLLQFLRLSMGACRGPKWETIEGNFCSLRILQIADADDLKYWDTDGAHFLRLEHLLLQFVEELEEIPSSIGDIPTLKSIRLVGCSKSADNSAKRIKEEQEDYLNEDLQVVIFSRSR